MKSAWEAQDFPSSLAFEEAKQAGDPAVTSGRIGRDEPTRAETQSETQRIDDMDPSYTSDKGSRKTQSKQLGKRGGKTTPIPTDGKGFRRLIGIVIAVVAIGGSALEDLDLDKVFDDFVNGFKSGFGSEEIVGSGTESSTATASNNVILVSGPIELDENSDLYTTASNPENQISYIRTSGPSIHLAAEVASNNAVDPVMIETDQLFSGFNTEVRLDITEDQVLQLIFESDGEFYEPLLLSKLPGSDSGKRFFDAAGKLLPGIVVEAVLTDFNEDGIYDLLILYDDYNGKTVLEGYAFNPFTSKPFTYSGFIESGRDFAITETGQIYDFESGDEVYYEIRQGEFKKFE